MKAFAALAVLLVLFSCQKDRVKLNDETHFIGKYEWYHSYGIYSDDYESYQSVSDQHGMRIKKNGKVEFYTNGRISEKGYVRHATDTMLIVNQGESSLTITLDDADLIVGNYPFYGHNKYKKHE